MMTAIDCPTGPRPPTRTFTGEKYTVLLKTLLLEVLLLLAAGFSSFIFLHPVRREGANDFI